MQLTLIRLTRPLNGWLQRHQITSDEHCYDVVEFFEAAMPLLKDLFSHLLNTIHSFKYQLKLKIIFFKDVDQVDETGRTADGYFSHTLLLILNQSEVDSSFDRALNEIQANIEAFESRGSGWIVQAIEHIDVHISRYRPLTASSYIPLPSVLAKSKAVINPQNYNDNKCFLYCLLAARYPEKNHPERISTWENLTHTLMIDTLSFPVSLENIKQIEIDNNLSINVYGFIEGHIHPLQISKQDLIAGNKNIMCVNLLMLEDGRNQHYCFIRNLDRLLHHQTKGKYRKFFCRRCLACFKSSKTKDSHFKQCRSDHILQRTVMPRNQNPCLHIESNCDNESDDETINIDDSPPIIEFKQFQKTLWCPLMIYVDFECLTEKLDLSVEPPAHISFTHRHHIHTPCGAAIQAVFRCCDNSDPIYEEPMLYRGDAPVKWCLEALIERGRSYQNHVDFRNKSIRMSKQEWNHFNQQKICYICDQPFEKCDNCFTLPFSTVRCQACRQDKRRDHCHFCSRYKGAAHNTCNLFCKVSRDVVVGMHNARRYDWHLIMQKIGRIANDNSFKIEVIAKTTEDYISLTLGFMHEHNFLIDHRTTEPLKFHWRLKFIDTYQFLSSSLANLVKNLLDKGKFHFTALRNFFPETKLHDLLLQKGIYPYTYMDGWQKFHERQLPPIQAFYNDLTLSNLSESEYEHAVTVFNEFNCESLGQYHDLYLLTDTLLLADVFENFRTFGKQHYNLDPANYITLPSFGWDACLKLTGVKLEMLTDPAMYEFFESGIRGGISVITHRFAKANNHHISGFIPSQTETYLLYLDANNLYGYSMIQSLPTSSFEWMSNEEIVNFKLNNLKDNSGIGYVLEVDLEYPQHLHDIHNDYPLAPERLLIQEHSISPYCKRLKQHMNLHSSSVPKLVPNLNNKYNYIVHGKNLELYLELGLKVTKIHRILVFEQYPWMKKYIDFNTEMRKSAKSSFEKDLFKLLNNSVFGKSMENVRNYIDIRIITNPDQMRKLISSPKYEGFTEFDEALVAVKMKRTTIHLNKPIYTGFTVLELSKHLMYSFHYKQMITQYGDKLKLLFSDTDSLCYQIETRDVYTDMKLNLDLYDTSDYPRNHFLFSENNKKVMGKMKDETVSLPIEEFVGLKSKMYSLRYGKIEKKTAKGVNKSVVKKIMTFNDYKTTLLNSTSMKHNMNQLRSHLHNMYTLKLRKTSLSAFDDKRYILEDGITSYAHGHYRINLQVNETDN